MVLAVAGKQPDGAISLETVLKKVRDGFKAEQPVILGVKCTEKAELQLETVRVLERYVQLLLLQNNLSTGACLVENPESLTHRTASLRMRLLTHRSVVEARHGDDVEALRFLNTAEAELQMVDPHRRSNAVAIVELHRAEVEIEAARVSRLSSVDDTITFEKYYRQLRGYADGSPVEPLDRNAEVLAAIYEGDRWNNVSARLRTALGHLAVAEEALLSRRKNVWWSTWLFQRQLKVIELQLWATVGVRDGSAIPFIGLEAAPRRTMTRADTLLENTCRMVRLDVYRLATVVETYAYCVWAVHLRIIGDRAAEAIPGRQEEMRRCLEIALLRLRELRKMRREADGIVPEGDVRMEATLDKDVAAYLQRVDGIVEKVIKSTQNVRC